MHSNVGITKPTVLPKATYLAVFLAHNFVASIPREPPKRVEIRPGQVEEAQELLLGTAANNVAELIFR